MTSSVHVIISRRIMNLTDSTKTKILITSVSVMAVVILEVILQAYFEGQESKNIPSFDVSDVKRTEERLFNLPKSEISLPEPEHFIPENTSGSFDTDNEEDKSHEIEDKDKVETEEQMKETSMKSKSVDGKDGEKANESEATNNNRPNKISDEMIQNENEDKPRQTNESGISTDPHDVKLEFVSGYTLKNAAFLAIYKYQTRDKNAENLFIEITNRRDALLFVMNKETKKLLIENPDKSLSDSVLEFTKPPESQELFDNNNIHHVSIKDNDCTVAIHSQIPNEKLETFRSEIINLLIDSEDYKDLAKNLKDMLLKESNSNPVNLNAVDLRININISCIQRSEHDAEEEQKPNIIKAKSLNIGEFPFIDIDSEPEDYEFFDSNLEQEQNHEYVDEIGKRSENESDGTITNPTIVSTDPETTTLTHEKSEINDESGFRETGDGCIENPANQSLNITAGNNEMENIMSNNFTDTNSTQLNDEGKDDIYQSQSSSDEPEEFISDLEQVGARFYGYDDKSGLFKYKTLHKASNRDSELFVFSIICDKNWDEPENFLQKNELERIITTPSAAIVLDKDDHTYTVYFGDQSINSLYTHNGVSQKMVEIVESGNIFENFIDYTKSGYLIAPFNLQEPGIRVIVKKEVKAKL